MQTGFCELQLQLCFVGSSWTISKLNMTGCLPVTGGTARPWHFFFLQPLILRPINTLHCCSHVLALIKSLSRDFWLWSTASEGTEAYGCIWPGDMIRSQCHCRENVPASHQISSSALGIALTSQFAPQLVGKSILTLGYFLVLFIFSLAVGSFCSHSSWQCRNFWTLIALKISTNITRVENKYFNQNQLITSAVLK